MYPTNSSDDLTPRGVTEAVTSQGVSGDSLGRPGKEDQCTEEIGECWTDSEC